MLAYIRVNANPAIPDYFVGFVEEVVRMESRFFDLYIHTPIEFPLQLDEVRPADEQYRAAIDEALFTIYRDFGLSFCVVRGSVENRLKEVLDVFALRGRE
jgi:predicted ATPase